MNTWDFMGEFVEALTTQLKQDAVRWGDTWLKRLPDGQESRSEGIINTYFDQYRNAGVPIPWLKIAGTAMICWIREKHPEIWNK